MITDRLSSGLPLSGRSELQGTDQVSGKSERKGPDGFADFLQSARAPQKDRPESGNLEEGSRTQKNLAVQDRKDSGDEGKVKKTEERDQSASEKSENREKALTLKPQIRKKAQSERQQAILEFMDSMESEFSIPPEVLAGAMVSLKTEDLGKSPEDTASQVIEKLNLQGDQQVRAEALYGHLLTKLSGLEESPTAESLAVPLNADVRNAVPGGIDNSQAILQNSEKLRRLQLNESLDRLNQKFFLNGPNDLGELAAVDLPMEQGKAIPETLQSPFAEKPQLAAYAEQKSALEIPKLTPLLSERSLPDGNFQALDVSMKNPMQDLKSLQREQGFRNPTVLGETSVADMIAQQGVPLSNAANMSSDFDMQMNQGARQSSDLELQASKPEVVSTGDFFIQPTMMERASSDKLAVATVGSNTPTSDTSTNPNLQQIMNQAMYAMKKGGGESVVRLSPEGLGDLHLKVVVSDGKVNLSMAAETKEAKSLIESNLVDLKNSLSSHNLKVESVKVDVGNQLASDQQASSQSGFKFDQGREQARQFLSNFQQENANQRGLFYDSPGMRAYGAPKDPEPLTPSPEAQGRGQRYFGEGRGNGLNLVA